MSLPFSPDEETWEGCLCRAAGLGSLAVCGVSQEAGEEPGGGLVLEQRGDQALWSLLCLVSVTALPIVSCVTLSK